MAAGLPIQATDINSEKQTVELTDAQKGELAALHKDIFGKKKELINKYVEFGIITKEKGDKIISRMEKCYEDLDENGFMPQWHKMKYRQ
ncbi:MAG: hypothetical protein APF76_17190 [Desulfitibacter sp. BRH_c19]|nr:MAG: hypothetical protein APF76_17190 [Desulfitibacter sp. BRH_c19]